MASPLKKRPPERILIVRLSAIGDTVHALPALRLLREAFPKAEIGWAVEDFAATFVQDHPDLDRVHIIPKKLWRKRFFRSFGPEILPFIRQMRSFKYDVAIDFQGLTKSGLVAWLSGAPCRIGFGDSQGKELNKIFTNEKATPPAKAQHIIERNAALLAPLGIDRPPEAPRIHLARADEIKADEIWQGMGFGADDRVAGLNVGAGWPTKLWPARHWADLADLLWKNLEMPVILLWGAKNERLVAEEAESMAKARGLNTRLAPATSVGEGAALTRKLALFFGGDTGPTHVAAAMGIATVGLYGATDPLRNGPFGQNAVAAMAPDQFCHYCWKRRCPKGEIVICMENLTPEIALDLARKALQ